jgi:hypothetical protein
MCKVRGCYAGRGAPIRCRSSCTLPSPPFGAHQHAKGSVQVSRPALMSANLRSRRGVAHDTGRQVAIPTSTAPARSELYSPQCTTAPRSGRRLPQGSGQRDTGHRARHRARHSAHEDSPRRSSTGHGVLVPAPANRPSLPGHAGLDAPGAASTSTLGRRDRDGRPRPRRVVVYRPRSKLGAPCPYQSACSCLLRLGAGR